MDGCTPGTAASREAGRWGEVRGWEGGGAERGRGEREVREKGEGGGVATDFERGVRQRQRLRGKGDKDRDWGGRE